MIGRPRSQTVALSGIADATVADVLTGLAQRLGEHVQYEREVLAMQSVRGGYASTSGAGQA